MAILAVLAGILFPVFAQAKRGAQVTSTVQKIHQLSLAIQMYRSENDGDARFGRASQMGLPPSSQIYKVAPPAMWKMPCQSADVTSFGTVYWPEDSVGPGSWEEIVRTFEESAPVIHSLSCTDSDWDVNNQFHPKLGIAADLSGRLLKKRKTGNPEKAAWWLN